jgi:hypothetical protein
MLDPSRLTRLITLAVASCAVTWAFAGAALARPDAGGTTTASAGAPAYKAVTGDADKAPVSAAPAFKGVAADANKTPDASQVQRVLNGVSRGKAGPVHPAVNGNDNTSTVALVLSIAAILTALGALSLIVTRSQQPPVLRA